jgi:hypothetical protein
MLMGGLLVIDGPRGSLLNHAGHVPTSPSNKRTPGGFSDTGTGNPQATPGRGT